ncbi:MAG: type IV pilus assembly protein PilM [Planctomycetota bacterium]
MAGSSECWGIEMGFGAIKALKLELDDGETRVIDYAVIPHAKVLSTPDLDQDDAMRVALGTLASQKDLSGARVSISLPGHQSFARFAKLPPVEPKKVPSIVQFEAAQQIPFPLEEVEWDFQTFVSPDSPDIEVGIFAVTRERINSRLDMLGDVGVVPDWATISPVAAYNALAVDLGFTEDTPGTIILDIGTVSTDLIIAEAGRVWVRTFPIGGHQFTEALVSAFKISYSKAEKLKREAEQTKHAKHVFQAMRPVFGDLAQEVQRSIGFYQSVHPDADLKRLIGLGSTFKLPGLRKYLKQQLQLDVYRIEQFKKLELDGPQGGEFQAASLNLTTAYGCALQALGTAPLRANLMPVPVLREAMWKRKVPYFAAAAGLAAAAAGAMFVRPLLDSSAYQGADKPPVIQRVVSEAGRLTRDAEESGVTSDVQNDLRAAQIVGLLESRALYASVLEDVAFLLDRTNEAARAAAGGDERLAELLESGPAIGLSGLQTSYAAGGGGLEEEDFGGRRRPRGGPSSAPDTETLPPEVAGKRHIKVVGQYDVAAPNLGRFMLDVVEPQLRELDRDGLEYDIVIGVQPWVGGAADASAGRTGGGPPYVRSGARQQSGRAASRPAPRTGNRTGGGSGSTNPNQVAPLPPIPEPRSGVTPVTITWYVVLDRTEDGGDA